MLEIPSTKQILADLLLGSLAALSPASRATIVWLVNERGRLDSVTALAARVGLGTRHQLRHHLMTDQLPPPQELAAWIRILGWLLDYEVHRLSLSHVALHEGNDPSTRYRLVRRLTGVDWREARSRGSAWALILFLDRCRQFARSGHARPNSA